VKKEGPILDIQAVEEERTLFPYQAWNARLPSLAHEYRHNNPVPHLWLANFLPFEVAHAAAGEFPAANTDGWIHWQHQNENKHGLAKRELFPACLGALVDELNSSRFLAWLSELTGVPNLLSDPSLEGGGLHQSGRGGFLNVHTDFSHHHYQQKWRRRLNLILYLNAGWRPDWGGDLELWDSRMRRCIAKFPPLLNQALIFNTDDKSFHGFPDPLNCPEGVSRNSLALYYYTVDGNSSSRARSTNYRARPGDSLRKSTLIWLDKQAVDLYSRAKVRFGFSDDFVSKILGFVSRDKT
jgi:hypothetical protein